MKNSSALILALLSLLSVGCGNSSQGKNMLPAAPPSPGAPVSACSPPSGSGPFLYVITQIDGLYGFRINGNGSLALLPNSPYRYPGNGLAFLNCTLYVPDPNSPGTTALSINFQNGALTPESTSVLQARHVMTTCGNKFIFSDNGDTSIFAAVIDAQGKLTPAPGPPIATGRLIAYLATDPSCHFLFAPSYSSPNIFAYSIASDGSLSSVPGSPFTAGSNSINTFFGAAVDPSGRFLYVTHLVDGIYGFAISSTGALAPIPGSPILIAGGAGPASLSVSLSSRSFLYVVTPVGIAGYEIDQITGMLTPVPGSSPAARPAVLLSSNNFLYGINLVGGIVAYTLNNDGSMTPLPGCCQETGLLHAGSAVIVAGT